MHLLSICLVAMVMTSSTAVEQYLLSMAGRGLNQVSRGFIKSLLAAEMLDMDVGLGEHSDQGRQFTGSGNMQRGFSRRFEPQSRFPQPSPYPSGLDFSLPELPISAFHGNQMTMPTSGQSVPPQLDNSQIPGYVFMPLQPAPSLNQFQSGTDDLFRSQQSISNTEQVGHAINGVFPPQLPVSSANQFGQGMNNLFRPQPPVSNTNQLGLSIFDLFRPQLPISGITTDQVQPTLSDFFKSQPPTLIANKPSPVLTNAIRSLLASPASDINKLLQLLGTSLGGIPPPGASVRKLDQGVKSNLLNSPQAVPRTLSTGARASPGFLRKIMTIGALDLVDLA